MSLPGNIFHEVWNGDIVREMGGAVNSVVVAEARPQAYKEHMSGAVFILGAGDHHTSEVLMTHNGHQSPKCAEKEAEAMLRLIRRTEGTNSGTTTKTPVAAARAAC